MAETADGATKADGAVTLESLAAIVADLATVVKEVAARPPVTERVQQVYTQGPGELPIAKTTNEILSGMRKGESRSGGEYIGPPGRRRLFRDNDVVELVDEDKLKLMRGGFQLPEGPLYGVVKALMYHRRKSGEPKYNIDFGSGINEDGCMESQLKAVQRD
jgi:hypothetical protein